MKFYAINGSPRKNKNTATLLQSALDGIQSTRAPGVVETEIIHLYSLNYQGCLSCFQCKRLGGKSYGKCAVKDSLSPVLDKLEQADGIIFGSPIYFGGMTGKMRSFVERFFFQYTVYDAEYSSLAPKKMPTAFIYTMNVPETVMREQDYQAGLRDMEFFAGNIFSTPQVMHAFNTYQFDDYSKYKVECFSEPEKAAWRDKQFPLDRERAFQLGASMALPL